ncbi:hypothetical protein JQK87_09565 [Streptomyces sp. G44]|uniref:hypothetical protein n=1 Tax=Streptomyces sp. G44 TaxID=2807632 RepID=UPI001961090F|nr:hypothetical protein [Streptomyces sp. G44]MBM7168654.1 hypothetical protein [Streptomyces sp. G44]
MGHDVFGETADRYLGGEVQHLVEVLGGEDLPVGTVVAAHGAVSLQDEEGAAEVTGALGVLAGRCAGGREHGVVEQVGACGHLVPAPSERALRRLHGRQHAGRH